MYVYMCVCRYIYEFILFTNKILLDEVWPSLYRGVCYLLHAIQWPF